MATIGSKTNAPVGSMRWALAEREQADQFLSQESEEFTFAARNEMEWLNEHMADIFNRSHFDVTKAFQTPGKLRGKTPRTAAKRNPIEARAPLTDIFAPGAQPVPSPSQNTNFYRQVVQFRVAEDSDTRQDTPRASSTKVQKDKENTDSSYHGISEDEIGQPTKLTHEPEEKGVPSGETRQVHGNPALAPRRASETSFASAEEEIGEHIVETNVSEDGDATESEDKEAEHAQDQQSQMTIHIDVEEVETDSPSAAMLADVEAPAEPEAADEETETGKDDVDASSEESTPDRPLVRKSSLTFASLPAREPLGSKSIGTRMSMTSHPDQHKAATTGRSSHVNKSLTGSKHVQGTEGDPVDEMDVDFDDVPISTKDETPELHNRTTTQRLHERINLLGQSRELRTSKSIPSLTHYPQLPKLHNEDQESHPLAPVDAFKASDDTMQIDQKLDNEDSWIAPPAASDHLGRTKSVRSMVEEAEGVERQRSIKSQASAKTFPASSSLLHQKSISVPHFSSPGKASFELSRPVYSTSHPNMASAAESSATPAGSPSKSRYYGDGPLSASKAKLFSVLKSAKGIFASSAGASAQAKLEALAQSQPPIVGKPTNTSPVKDVATAQPYPKLPDTAPESSRTSSASISSKASQGRRTRASLARDEQRRMKAAEEAQQAASELAQSLGEEFVEAPETAASAKPVTDFQAAIPDPAEDVQDDLPPPPRPKEKQQVSQLQQPRELRRPVKPTREPVTKLRPAPVSIRVASQSQRALGQNPPSNAALAAGLQSSLPPPVQAKQASAAPPINSAANGLKSSTSRPKALEAAAKKKEADEREAQRKFEQKREIERKRAAKAEDDMKAEEQRKATERQRILDARKAVQIAEQRKTFDQAKKVEQQRPQAAVRAKANDLNAQLQQEKMEAPHTRGRQDLGGARPASRMMQDLAKQLAQPHINPAKPPKRALQPEQEDEPLSKPHNHVGSHAYQQNDSKRRRTEDEENFDPEPRLNMAAPIRYSNMRKEMPAKFPHGYVPASQQSQSQSMLKFATQNPIQQTRVAYPNDIAKFSNAKIPFAEVANPPFASHSGPLLQTAHSQHSQPSQQSQPSQLHRTPGQMAGQPQPPPQTQNQRSSPAYPPSEQIQLPEIATDSEDEPESSPAPGSFRAPSWAASPALRELLIQQQLVDPASIFGPIGELKMEDVFKGNKERLKRFRDRTSSAIWDRGDRLTDEERRRDREMRERLEREGGWRFGLE